MTISSGSRLGPYEIASRLGVGGMGEVYRARDTRLQRDVAIKALPPEFASDPERLARFQREARLLASLNHPNIASIYGLEEADGARYLVLEIVEGESLAQKLAAGPLPVEESLAVCAQIAAGVSAAHEAGVIHRDLKPGNVMVRPDGTVKVLDFGLAKGTETPGSASASDLSASPTISVGTQAGAILGTAAYMSPEQARGRALDKRTDVWSFGCILYECLTGRQTFREETVSDTLASIIKSDPDWSVLPAETPVRIRDLLLRCLQKDPRRRLHDIADARLEIEEALATPTEPIRAPRLETRVRSRRATGPRLLWAAGGIVLGAASAILFSRAIAPQRTRAQDFPVASVLAMPVETQLVVGPARASMAFSPDGRRLVFRAQREGAARLYIRALDSNDAVPIAGTEGGFGPFFSPDGEWLAFFTTRELKKVHLAGGSPLTITVVSPVTIGGTWMPDGAIVFNRAVNRGLYTVSSGGGTPKPLTTPDPSSGEWAHVWPQALDEKNILVVVRSGKDFMDIPASRIAVHSLTTGKRRVLVENSAFALYAAGYLLFSRGTTVFAAPCDPRRWELTGPAFPLFNSVLTSIYDGSTSLALGRDVLAFVPGGVLAPPNDTLVWVDRSGREEPLPLPAGTYDGPRISPDGRRLALSVGERAWSGRSGIFVYDFERKVLSPITPEPGRHLCPAWTPDGRRIAFSEFFAGEPRLAWRAADGSGEIERLSPGGIPEFPASFSPDGRLLAYTTAAAVQENTDLWLLSLDGKREKRSWLETSFRELAPFFSPDGHWIAYVSNESGRSEVYVRPLAGTGGKVKISKDGGAEPAWSRDGREIFYRTAEALMAVPIRTEPEFSAGEARAILPDHYVHYGREDDPRTYDVSSDGSRFLFVKREAAKETPVTRIDLLTNWRAAVERAAQKR